LSSWIAQTENKYLKKNKFKQNIPNQAIVSYSDLFTIIVLFTRYLCSVWAIKKLNRMSRFQRPNYIKILAEKVAKSDRRAP
jgi:hypothetical protein